MDFTVVVFNLYRFKHVLIFFNNINLIKIIKTNIETCNYNILDNITITGILQDFLKF